MFWERFATLVALDALLHAQTRHGPNLLLIGYAPLLRQGFGADKRKVDLLLWL